MYNAAARVIIALNISGAAQRVFLPNLSPLRDALNQCAVSARDGGIEIELPAQSGAFLV